MRGYWVRALRIIDCHDSTCARSLTRGEPVYLVAGSERCPICERCAKRRYDQVPPATLKALAPIVMGVPAAPNRIQISDASEPTVRFTTYAWGSVARKSKGELARLRQQLESANASDGKLRQIGGDQ